MPDTADRRAIRGAAMGIGLAVGAYGISFGAIGVASGLNLLQTQLLSTLMFTGASQFALVGVLGTGGGVLAAVATSTLLGARNGLYALHLAPTLRARGATRALAAHLTIDESTAMAIAHEAPGPQFADTAASEASRYAFWVTGFSVFLCWNAGTLLGGAGASLLSDPALLGLDAAIPAGFLALLWPRLRDRTAWAVAGGGALVALVLIPLTRPGVPVLASALVALGAAWRLRDAASIPAGESEGGQ